MEEAVPSERPYFSGETIQSGKHHVTFNYLIYTQPLFYSLIALSLIRPYKNHTHDLCENYIYPPQDDATYNFTETTVLCEALTRGEANYTFQLFKLAG